MGFELWTVQSVPTALCQTLHDLYCLLNVIYDGLVLWHSWVRIQFGWENSREIDNLQDIGADGGITLRGTFRKIGLKGATGFIWLIMWTAAELM
jgi:hypothetical protein